MNKKVVTRKVDGGVRFWVIGDVPKAAPKPKIEGKDLGFCHFCQKPVSKKNNFCNGCKILVCKKCDVNENEDFLAKHEPEVHRKNG